MKVESDGFGIELTVTLLFVLWTFTPIFLLCAAGEMVTDQFDVFNAELCMCNWYMFPLEVQKMLIIFLAGSQDPVNIHGFADTICALEAYKRVIRSSYIAHECEVFCAIKICI